MRFALACLTAVLLGLLASFAVACGGGGDDRRLIAERRVQSMSDDLDAIDRFVEDGRCEAARDRLESLRAKVDGLPRDTDRKLRDRLEEGVSHLDEIAPDECRDNTTDTTETTETTETIPETTPPETVAPPTTTQAPETTEEPPPTTTQVPPAEPPSEEPPAEVPGESGGAEAPGANIPPGQAKKDKDG